MAVATSRFARREGRIKFVNGGEGQVEVGEKGVCVEDVCVRWKLERERARGFLWVWWMGGLGICFELDGDGDVDVDVEVGGTDVRAGVGGFDRARPLGLRGGKGSFGSGMRISMYSGSSYEKSKSGICKSSFLTSIPCCACPYWSGSGAVSDPSNDIESSA